MRIFREFSHDPFSWNQAKSVKTSKFIVAYKMKLEAYLTSQKIFYIKGKYIFFVRISNQLREIYNKEKQQLWRDCLPLRRG